MILEIN